jgi:hypothetical protein
VSTGEILAGLQKSGIAEVRGQIAEVKSLTTEAQRDTEDVATVFSSNCCIEMPRYGCYIEMPV